MEINEYWWQVLSNLHVVGIIASAFLFPCLVVCGGLSCDETVLDKDKRIVAKKLSFATAALLALSMLAVIVTPSCV